MIDTRIDPTPVGDPAADNGESVKSIPRPVPGDPLAGLPRARAGADALTLHTQPGLSRKPKSIESTDFSYVATNQMGDRSVLEPMKVVPSRDITPGRRKEPMNRGWPNETS